MVGLILAPGEPGAPVMPEDAPLISVAREVTEAKVTLVPPLSSPSMEMMRPPLSVLTFVTV